MDFCNRAYGFFHLPTLMIFINPFSQDKAVKDFFLDGPPLKKINSFIATHEREQSKDLLQRLSSLVHEQKHFHDILLTPYGNTLVRQSFKYAMAAFVLFSNRNWKPESSVPLPLQAGYILEPDALERASKIRKEAMNLRRSARLTLEALATLAQLQFLWTMYGEEAALAVQEDFAPYTEYSGILKEFIDLGNNLSFISDHFGALIHQILLIGLGTPEPSSIANSHDEFFKAVCEKIRNLPINRAEQLLKAAIKQAWVVVEENMQITETDNDKFLAALEKVMAWAPPEVAEAVVKAFDDFRLKSRAFRSEFLRDKEAYLHLDRYSNGDATFVEPLVYLYSNNDKLSLFYEPLDVDKPDIVANAIYNIPDRNVTYYSHRVQPSAYTLGGISMERPCWVDFCTICRRFYCALRRNKLVSPAV